MKTAAAADKVRGARLERPPRSVNGPSDRTG